jgi:photosystem II stability/assembly factor-like uncharacterized protein
VSRAAVLAAAAVAVVLVLGVGFFVATRDAGPGSGDDATMEHIHGLGVDPADGTVYAGTHYGLFRISPDGEEAERVADRVQDFMGFTVAGPDRFLASGHPGEGQEGPGSVGLIESTDAGETWTGLSLAGEADFHALEFRHDRVYGLNAMTGEFMMSNDLSTWETRSSLAMADFAVSPEDPNILLATTQDGLARSTDGGRTFSVVENAPLVQLVGWADDGTIAAVTPDGVVYSSRDAGTTWTEGAELGGAPEALTVESATKIYAAANGTVLASQDGGRTFTALYPR